MVIALVVLACKPRLVREHKPIDRSIDSLIQAAAVTATISIVSASATEFPFHVGVPVRPIMVDMSWRNTLRRYLRAAQWPAGTARRLRTTVRRLIPQPAVDWLRTDQ
jgi:hypothetical protein